MKKKRVELKLELEQVLIIRGRRTPITAWCAGCQAQVALLRPEEAAVVAGLAQRAIFRLIEAGQLHFIETDDGSLFVCSVSLPTPVEPQL